MNYLRWMESDRVLGEMILGRGMKQDGVRVTEQSEVESVRCREKQVAETLLGLPMQHLAASEAPMKLQPI
jgi:hypothetical protein